MSELADAIHQDLPESEQERTELGAARHLVRLHGQDLRFNTDTRRWIHWTGKRWIADSSGEAMRRAKMVPEQLRDEAEAIEQDKAREALKKHARSLETARKLEAMLKLASTEPGIPVSIRDLDRRHDLLGVENGVIRLTDGALQPPDRAHLITRSCGCEYDPGADRTDVLRVVQQITQGDADLAGWLQRALGYTLFGHAREEVLFFVGGEAATGKTTLLESVHQALGDYGATASFSTFLQDRQKNTGASPDVARLAGARMVLCEEVDEGARLAEGAVKQMTGRSVVVARHLYGEFFEFLPNFKLWLVANDRPRVRDDDPGVWRRMRYLHLGKECVVAEADRDPQLKERLTDPARSMPGLLAWLVDGAVLYHAKGLGQAERVRGDSQDYRAEMDPLGAFLEEHCYLRPGDEDFRVPQKELRRIYEHWASDQGDRWTMNGKQLGRRLRALGVGAKVARYQGQAQKCWVGIQCYEDKAEREAQRYPLPHVTSSQTSAHTAGGPAQSTPQVSDEVTSGNRLQEEGGAADRPLLPRFPDDGEDAPW